MLCPTGRVSSRAFALALACAGLAALAAGTAAPMLPSFSDQRPGPIAGWQPQALGQARMPVFEIVADGATYVARAFAKPGAAGTMAYPLSNISPSQLLTWRWKVDHANLKADPTTREGDDYAARVYVSFNVPLESLAFADRTKLRLARALYGPSVPTAALCYVWDNSRPIGTHAVSPYTSRVHIIVLQSGGEFAGRWRVEQRNLAADFKAAFAHDAPAVTGIAFGLDMDQTGDTNTAWFGDFVLRGES